VHGAEKWPMGKYKGDGAAIELRRKIGKFKISSDCSSIKTSDEYGATQVEEGCYRETKTVLVLLVFFPYKDLLRESYTMICLDFWKS
jgi:hypothetical protein